MGRSPFARKHTLWLSAISTVVGIALTVLAYTASYPPGGWNAFYENIVPSSTQAGDWNLLVRVVAPVLLASGGWYFGEQIWIRRKFNQMIDQEKKSEFRKRVDELEEMAGKLPKRYEDKLDEASASFASKR